MKFAMTYHAQIERIDRITHCLELLGMNEFILEVKQETRTFRLTDTGILFVFDGTGQVLITGYMANPLKVASLYKSCGINRVPQKTWMVVTRNSKKYKFLLEE